MECISVFDMLKIGVGPSSSHTLGPWRAAERWIEELRENDTFSAIEKIQVILYGSLSLTGKGHATDTAVALGLLGTDPVTIPTEKIPLYISEIKANKRIKFGGENELRFDFDTDIVFKREFLPFHANGIEFKGQLKNGTTTSEIYYSIGGGFVVKEERINSKENKAVFKTFPFPIKTGAELLAYCKKENKPISEIVLDNERSLASNAEINTNMKHVWDTMLECMYTGCHSEGILPGGLNVRRRAFDMHQKLKGELPYSTPLEWLKTIRETEVKFRQILKWVSCFALAVNEVNASLGRVVTAPTNGSIFKKGATISAAMGGCQAEIGVSSAMAAGALTELMGGTPEQVLCAAEIAMEHHLGLTCDPIGGLVQVPCIERNSMGAIKAINAAELAMDTDPAAAKVPLDKVVNTMWETAKDMSSKYKETSEGGLAVGVFLSDC